MRGGAKPWYREFWLWFVLAPLIAVVLGSLVTIVIAGRVPPLVVDDFSRIPLTVERNFARDRRAGELRLSAEVEFAESPPGMVRVTLAGAAPEEIQLEIIHPTRDDRDQRLLLRRAAEGYSARAETPTGRVYLQIGDAAGTWRLTGERRPGEPRVRLAARTDDVGGAP